MKFRMRHCINSASVLSNQDAAGLLACTAPTVTTAALAGSQPGASNAAGGHVAVQRVQQRLHHRAAAVGRAQG